MRISAWSSDVCPTDLIVDRRKDIIAVGGFKVYPSVIEAHLYEHPAVREAIVLGVPDAYRGEVPKAFVTLEEGFDVSGEALTAWLNPQLGKHERVKMVEVRSEEQTSELQSLMRTPYAVYCLKKKHDENTSKLKTEQQKAHAY